MDKALVASAEYDEVERQLKQLFLSLLPRNDLYDIDATGAPWWKSSGSTQQAILDSGLSVLNYDIDAASRYIILREWHAMSNGKQKRGLDFLRFYLGVLFPGQTKVEQLWLDKNSTYPTEATRGQVDFSWWLYQLNEPGLQFNGAAKINPQNIDPNRESTRVGTSHNAWLSSRVRITFGFDNASHTSNKLVNVIKQIVPARIVPEFVLWSSRDFYMNIRGEMRIHARINSDYSFNKNAVLVTSDNSRGFRVSYWGNPPRIGLDARVETIIRKK